MSISDLRLTQGHQAISSLLLHVGLIVLVGLIGLLIFYISWWFNEHHHDQASQWSAVIGGFIFVPVAFFSVVTLGVGHYVVSEPITYHLDTTVVRFDGLHKLTPISYNAPLFTVKNARFKEAGSKVDLSRVAMQLDYTNIKIGDQVTIATDQKLTKSQVDYVGSGVSMKKVDPNFKVHVLKVERPTSQQKMQVIYQD